MEATTHFQDKVYPTSNLHYVYPLANNRVLAKKCELSNSNKKSFKNDNLSDRQDRKQNRVDCLNKQFKQSKKV